MEVMLLKDVYKLGRAGDVKRVANGYGRNFLIPQGLATMATPGALTQSDRIRASAEEERARLNQELTAVFEVLNGLQVNFPVKAGETGKLYGSVTTQMISEAVMENKGIEVDRSQIVSEPIRSLGVHLVKARLTVDLIAEINVVVHREELPPESAFDQVVEEAEETEAFADLQAELEAEEAEKQAAEEDEQSEQEGEQGHEQAEQVEAQAARQEEQPEEGQAAEADERSELDALFDEIAEGDNVEEEGQVDTIASEEGVEKS
jgi:large subunit ribosomal protein L9